MHIVSVDTVSKAVPYHRVADSSGAYMTVPTGWTPADLVTALDALGKAVPGLKNLPPPLGEKPDFAEIDRLRRQIKDLQEQLGALRECLSAISNAVLPNKATCVMSLNEFAKQAGDAFDSARKEADAMRAQSIEFDRQRQLAEKERKHTTDAMRRWIDLETTMLGLPEVRGGDPMSIKRAWDHQQQRAVLAEKRLLEKTEELARYTPFTKRYVRINGVTWEQSDHADFRDCGQAGAAVTDKAMTECRKLTPREAAWRHLTQHAIPEREDIVNAIEAYVEAAKP